MIHNIREDKITSSTIRITWQQGQTFKTMDSFIKYFLFSVVVRWSFYGSGVLLFQKCIAM